MPTTCALCRRVVPDERIPDPQVVQEHHLRPEEGDTSPTVTIEALRSADRLDGYLDWIRGTDKLRINVDTSDAVRDRS